MASLLPIPFQLVGGVSGQSSVMMLDGWTWEHATLKHPSGLHINWPAMSIKYGKNIKKSEKKQREEIQKSSENLMIWSEM